MQKPIAPILSLLLLSIFVSGCDFIGDVLEFGFWTGVILVVLVGLVVWGIVKVFRK